MRTTSFAHIVIVALALSACGGGEPAPIPAAIEARVDPARLWYRTGQNVRLFGFVTDQLGQPIEDVEVAWTVEPTGAASAQAPEADPRQARFTLSQPGRVVFTGCVVPDERGTANISGELCSSITLRVDDGMPTLEVETPTPGAELDDAEGIRVRGSVADRSVVRVYVNGEAAAVDDLGVFETVVRPQLGVNHLVVDASDGLTEPAQVQMDVLWAPAFGPALGADGRPEIVLSDGLALRLGQSFFDDGMAFDPAVTPVQTRDLADLLELVVTRLDTTSLVPDPVISSSNFTLRVVDVTLGAPRAEIDLDDDAADLFVRIGAIQADTAGGLTIDGVSLPLTGTIRASAVAYARLTIRKESEESPVEVDVGELTVGIESLEGTFVSEETAAVFRLAEGLFRNTLEGALSNAVRDTVLASVPAVLEDALSAVDTALAGQSLPLNTPPFPPVTIQLDGRMRSLDTVYRREMLATLRTTLRTDVMSIHPDSRGVARFDTAEMSPDFFRDGSVSVGVRMSMLNGLLHALWSSGLFDIDVTPLLPTAISGLVSGGRLEGRLPPVLRPRRAQETDDLVLSLGQLELELVFMGSPARFAISLDAGVNVEVADNRIALQVAETPRIRVWTLVPPEDPRALTPEIVAELLQTLWPDLRASVADGLAFELPLPALGDLGGLAPDLAGLTLELETTDRVRPRGDVLLLDARLVGRLP
jgi:hypothetical protein